MVLSILLPVGPLLTLTAESISRTFSLLLIQFPVLIIRYIPRCESIISLTHLYVFFQALGILWSMYVTVVSVAATKLGAAWVDLSTLDLLRSFPYYATKLYIHVVVLQVSVGFGKSLWRNGWEVYADYPTCRALLNPKAAVTTSTRKAQIILLMCPLIVSGVVAGIIGLVQLSLRIYPESPSDESSVRIILGDPQSRLNRIFRFTVWIGLLQWAQMFQFVFPRWPRAVAQFSTRKKISLLFAFSLLVPISIIRSLQWVVVITPPTSHQVVSVLYTLGGVSWDCLLMVSWTVVMFSIATEILGKKENLKLVEWKKEAFTTESVWREGAILLKFGYLFACLLLFVRAFLSANKGFSYGQNDLIALTVSYPLFMVITWWATNATLVLVKRRLAGIIVLLFGPLSIVLCRFANISASGAVAGLWVHLIKNFVRFKRASGTSGNSPMLRPVGPRMPNGSERYVANTLTQIVLPFTYSYAFLLLLLSVLSLVQRQMDVTPPGEFMSVVRPDSQTISVRHAVSEMNLFLSDSAPLKRRQDPPDLPIYGICGKDFWGLNVIDYGLFSMVSYVGDSEAMSRTVRSVFPQNWDIQIIDNSSSFSSSAGKKIEKFWTEFQVNNSTTVIAVRGSEFWRVSDYLEDLRMWTEPVAKSLLTLIFPTVRAWSPKTTAMVFDAYQEFLSFIGIPDDIQYKYQQLLDYIKDRNFSPSDNVVLTGHSLGGGIAQIVGAIARVPTVTFLSPGMYQTASKFFFHSSRDSRQIVELVHNQSVSIQVENDFVGKYLDSHAGLVQTITCSVDHLAPLTCHLIDNCICNLIRHCKDPRFPGGCDFKYDFDIFLNATFPEERYDSWRKALLEPISHKLNEYFAEDENKAENNDIRGSEL